MCSLRPTIPLVAIHIDGGQKVSESLARHGSAMSTSCWDAGPGRAIDTPLVQVDVYRYNGMVGRNEHI